MSITVDCHVETEGHLKVTSSHVHHKRGNISAMLQAKRCCDYRRLIGRDMWPTEMIF